MENLGSILKGEDQAVEDLAEGVKAEPPAAKVEPEPEPDHVPVKALQEERRKRQELERQLSEYQQQRHEVPDPVENPEGYASHLQGDFQFRLLNERLNMSETLAVDKHGEEAVLAAQELFQQAASQDPALANRLVSEKNPYAWVMKWAKGQKFSEQMGDDPEAYWGKREKDLRTQWEAEQKSPVRTPSPSLASAPSAPVKESVYQGPTPLNKILFGKKR